jgi:hypothetical protein
MSAPASIMCCRFAADRNSTGTMSKAPSSSSTIMRSHPDGNWIELSRRASIVGGLT